jgi:CheY-like chemotaxis protein
MARILLVEDDRMNREMLLRRLKWDGFDVVTAVDGAQAIEQAEQILPDLILMDMGLPVLNGWEASQRIRELPTTRHIPIIALTAYATTEDREASLRAGCNEFETKPVNFTSLKEKMMRLIKS